MKKTKKDIFYNCSDGKPIGETGFHITQILNLIEQIRIHYSAQKDIYVTGNLMFYYEQGNSHKVFSPDVMIVKGVGKHPRRSYKLWEEKQFPQVIFEISSRRTWGEDLNKEWSLYQQFGVKEYYIFDPEYDYLPEPLIAYRLKKDELKKVTVKRNRIFSEELGLEIVDTGAGLRLYNPQTKEFLGTIGEELKARLNAEAEIVKLRREIKKLKSK